MKERESKELNTVKVTQLQLKFNLKPTKKAKTIPIQ